MQPFIGNEYRDINNTGLQTMDPFGVLIKTAFAHIFDADFEMTSVFFLFDV